MQLVFQDVVYDVEQVGSDAGGAVVRTRIAASVPTFNGNGVTIRLGTTLLGNSVYYTRYIKEGNVYAYKDYRTTMVDGSPAFEPLVEVPGFASMQTNTELVLTTYLPIARGNSRVKKETITVTIADVGSNEKVTGYLEISTSAVRQPILSPPTLNIAALDRVDVQCSYVNSDGFYNKAILYVNNSAVASFNSTYTYPIQLTNLNKGKVISVYYQVTANDGKTYQTDVVRITLPSEIAGWYKTSTGWREIDKIFYVQNVPGVFSEIGSLDYQNGKWSALAK